MGMKQTSQNVTFAKPFVGADRSGYIWVAPLGTVVPTDATSELDTAFKGLGYLSEDGLVEPASMEEADGIVAAGGDTVAKGDPTFTKTWTGTAIEALNTDLLTVVYGDDNVTVSDGGEGEPPAGSIIVNESARSIDHKTIIIDELLANGRRRRNIMADAQFLVTGDITHSHTELMNYEFTITAYPTENMPAQKIYIEAPKV